MDCVDDVGSTASEAISIGSLIIPLLRGYILRKGVEASASEVRPRNIFSLMVESKQGSLPSIAGFAGLTPIAKTDLATALTCPSALFAIGHVRLRLFRIPTARSYTVSVLLDTVASLD